MDRTRSQVAVLRWHGNRRAIYIAGCFRNRCVQGPGTQVVEEQLLLSAEEAELEPAEDVVHDRLGKADVGVAGPAAGLEAGVREFFAEKLERHTVLESD